MCFPVDVFFVFNVSTLVQQGPGVEPGTVFAVKSIYLLSWAVALYLGRNLAEIESHSLETSRNRRIFFGFPVTLSFDVSVLLSSALYLRPIFREGP